MENQEALKVVIRLRPANELEKENAKVAFVDRDKHEITIRGGDKNVNLSCLYDAVFDGESTQQDLYDVVKPSIEKVPLGFNATIFAYGQTGTGKTYTMLGENADEDIVQLKNLDSNCWGIVPRSVNGLFSELEQMKDTKASAIVHCSYLQIYNNEVYDLLQDTMAGRNAALDIREMIKGNNKQIYASGLSEFRVECTLDVLKLLEKGTRNRNIRATEMNEKSSRSHAVLQLSTEVESRGNDGATIIRRAKLNLIDLAGSEKWDVTGAMQKKHTKELTNINKSLSALGNVISALCDRNRLHIPYRDSKLTRLLQNSLGGNTQTTVIATLSPSITAIDETIATLQFADRAKNVMVRVQANEVVDDAVLLARAQREIARLKLLLKQQSKPENSTHSDKEAFLQSQVLKLTKANKKLETQVRKLKNKQPSVNQPASNYNKSEVMLDANKDLYNEALNLQDLRHQLQPSNSTDDAGTTDPQYVIQNLQQEKRMYNVALGENNILSTPNDGNDEESCPICHRAIDLHTDVELDACIDKEASTSLPPQELPHIIPPKDVVETSRSEDDEKPSVDSLIIPQIKSKSCKSKNRNNQQVKKLLKSPLVAKGKARHRKKQLKNKANSSGMSFSVKDIGTSLQIYQFRYDSWYNCDVVGYDSQRQLHCCQFEYGDKQWQDLGDKNFKILNLEINT